MDSQTDRHIVQILNKDETVVYATILAIPNYRLKATSKTVITFQERPDGQPEALRAWFYPGNQWGQEFVYPKSRAMQIAKETNTPVLFTAVEVPVEVEQPIQSADEPVVVQLKQAPVMAVVPTGEEVELAQVVTPPPAPETLVAAAPVTPPPAQPTQVAMAELPRTASELPLVGLLGLLALGAAFTLRSALKRAV